MLLVIDIGNTNISFGVLKGKRVVGRFCVDTLNEISLRKTLKGIHEKYPSLNRGALCSVVPRVSRNVQKEVEKIFGFKVVIVGKDIFVPIKNSYRKPEQVGQDRLVVAYAVKVLYGAPAIVIDFGTAITFDIISAKGVYEGGMIVPGIKMSSESLFQKTSLLPSIDPNKVPRNFIGKDTEESILSGIFYGYGAMCCGLIDLVQKKFQGKAKVIVTGGHTQLMRKFIHKKINKIDKDLVFHGMRLTFDEK